MSLSARKISTKLATMSWDEFRTRLAQTIGKRVEYGLYRAGLQHEPHVRALTSNRASRFFFSDVEIPARIALLRQHLPDVISDAITEADEILQHRFRLLGYRDLDYGAEIDWRLDAVHGKRTPLKPWYKINFLDFNQVGDHKITWELNRHQHLVTLAKAWAFTGDKKYTDEIEHQLQSWHKANPYPLGINWGSSLEVAFRSLSWIWVRQLLGTSLSSDFDRDLMQGLARNAHYIERYLSTYFSPNTHLIGEALALFFIAVICPEIPAAPRWKAKGQEILTKEIQRQVRPDGVYFEQSLYYHVYALDMFLHARILAQANGLRLPESYDEVLRKMLGVVETLCRSGPSPGFGDDDGGRLFNPRRNRAEHMADSLTLGACLFDEISLPSARLTEEAIWLCGESAIARCNNGDACDLSSSAFEYGGLYVIASDGPHRMQMLVDCGPHGTGHGGHGHADALSLQLLLDRQPFLVDPGSYVYISAGDERNQFRGTVAHNTLRVDKLDQAVPETPFSWSSLPKVGLEHWESGEQFTFFSGFHTGYQRLNDPVLHRRAIFHLSGEYFVICDTASGQAQHDLEIFWHFSPGTELEARERSLLATSGSQQLAILGCAIPPWKSYIEEGFVSPAYGQKRSAPVGVFRSNEKIPTAHCSVIVPFSASKPLGDLRMVDSSTGIAGYSYQRGEIEDQFVFGQSGQQWRIGPIAGDADFFFLRRERQEIMMLAFGAASFIEIAGLGVFSSPERVRRFEWNPTRGAMAADKQSLKFFHGEFLRAGTPVR